MKKLVVFIIVVLILLGVYSSGFQIPEGYSAVVTRFGRPVKVTDEAGLYWKFPAPIERIHLIDHRISLLRPPALELLTADKRNIMVEVFVVYQVDDPLRYLVGAGTPLVAEAHLLDMVLAHLGAQVGKRDFLTFLGNQDIIQEIISNVTQKVDQKSQTNLGIGIRRIGFRRLIFPSQNAASVIRRMKAERDKIARKYQSEGREKAMQIEAETEKERGRILATADEEALKIRAKADAEGARIYTESYTRDRKLFRFLKTLETSEAVLKKNATIILPQDSQFLDPLFRGGE
ncbi:MAG: protease modulator HflC [Deltaproteobacteria bacterium]|nr:protease modulator HflC [Deltaproteobacteria bacterium]